MMRRSSPRQGMVQVCVRQAPCLPLYHRRAIGGVIDQLPLDSIQLVKSLSGFNLTTSDPLYSTILAFFSPRSA